MTAQDTAGLVAELRARLDKRRSDLEREVTRGWAEKFENAAAWATFTVPYNELAALLDALTAKASDLAEARAALRCVQQQCETAVYNITQREHDEAVVRSFQSIADFCVRTVLSREKEAG